MTFAMRYICEKANPKNIVAYGFTMAKGGLGVFDTEKYQEVTGELPPGSMMKPPESSTPPPSQGSDSTIADLQKQVAALQAQLAALLGKGLLGK